MFHVKHMAVVLSLLAGPAWSWNMPEWAELTSDDEAVTVGPITLTAHCSVLGAPSMATEKGIYPPALVVMRDADGNEMCRYHSVSLDPCDHCPEKGKPIS